MGPITVQIVRNHFEPLLAIAFLLTFCCFLVIYFVILKWVKKGNLDIPKLERGLIMEPRVAIVGRAGG